MASISVAGSCVCVRDYVYDDGCKRFTVKKGTPFTFNVHGVHHDPKYFENPDKFDPERFSVTNKQNIMPGTFIPFGVGPRACIGEFELHIMKLRYSIC